MRTLIILIAGCCLFAAAPVVTTITPAVETETAAFDVDDPAIWIHPHSPERSLIVGTVKRAAPEGALNVYNLEGKIVETVPDVDRPNNVDILGDTLVVTERNQRRLRVYRVSENSPHLNLIGFVPVFEGEPGETGAPMGVALYQRPKDKALFAIVSRKTGPTTGYLWEYRLVVEGNAVRATKVRQFGSFSGTGEIEAVAVDQKRGLVFYSDESCCVHVYRADPNAPSAETEIARFGETGFGANREGIAITERYVIVTDQLDPQSEYHLFDRKTFKEVQVWRGLAQSTDGADATSRRLSRRFPHGVLVVMNNRGRNFHLYALP